MRRAVTGDFIAYSPWWNWRCEKRRDAHFLENPINTFGLKVLNDDEATRPREGGLGHSSTLHGMEDLGLRPHNRLRSRGGRMEVGVVEWR